MVHLACPLIEAIIKIGQLTNAHRLEPGEPYPNKPLQLTCTIAKLSNHKLLLNEELVIKKDTTWGVVVTHENEFLIFINPVNNN